MRMTTKLYKNRVSTAEGAQHQPAELLMWEADEELRTVFEWAEEDADEERGTDVELLTREADELE